MAAARLVADSVAEAELAECLAKARFLTDTRSGTDRSRQHDPSPVLKSRPREGLLCQPESVAHILKAEGRAAGHPANFQWRYRSFTAYDRQARCLLFFPLDTFKHAGKAQVAMKAAEDQPELGCLDDMI
jgi:hypothetical protein